MAEQDTETADDAGREASALTALLPCPFCGRGALVVACGDNREAAKCVNPECAVEPETDDFATPEEAVTAWNTRAG